jgi:hypothetical protein
MLWTFPIVFLSCFIFFVVVARFSAKNRKTVNFPHTADGNFLFALYYLAFSGEYVELKSIAKYHGFTPRKTTTQHTRNSRVTSTTHRWDLWLGTPDHGLKLVSDMGSDLTFQSMVDVHNNGRDELKKALETGDMTAVGWLHPMLEAFAMPEWPNLTVPEQESVSPPRIETSPPASKTPLFVGLLVAVIFGPLIGGLAGVGTSAAREYRLTKKLDNYVRCESYFEENAVFFGDEHRNRCAKMAWEHVFEESKRDSPLTITYPCEKIERLYEGTKYAKKAKKLRKKFEKQREKKRAR